MMWIARSGAFVLVGTFAAVLVVNCSSHEPFVPKRPEVSASGEHPRYPMTTDLVVPDDDEELAAVVEIEEPAPTFEATPYALIDDHSSDPVAVSDGFDAETETEAAPQAETGSEEVADSFPQPLIMPETSGRVKVSIPDPIAPPPVATPASITSAAPTPAWPVDYFPEQGLALPTDFRSWPRVEAVPIDLGQGKPLRLPTSVMVFMDPDSWIAYQEAKELPDGTVLIKEAIELVSEEMVSVEVSLKSPALFTDSQGGWAHFRFSGSDDPSQRVQTSSNAQQKAFNSGWSAASYSFFAYGQAPEPEPDASTSAGPPTTELPTDAGPLFTYLQSAQYRNFPAFESRRHPTSGPHSGFGKPVRVYLDRGLNDSLAESMTPHPTGATAVLEMFDAHGTVSGWAVMHKTQANSAEGQGWFFYEIRNARDTTTTPMARGAGVESCVQCHQAGRDFLLSDYPLR